MPGTPRWLALRDVPVGSEVLQEAYGRARWRHVVKTLLVPHLIVPGRRLVLGIAPFPGGSRRRQGLRASAVSFAWLLSRGLGGGAEGDGLPWALRPERACAWRLINLARSPADQEAARFTADLASFALALADRHHVELRAEVAHDRPRLLRIYRRRGFTVIGEDERNIFLRRAPAGIMCGVPSGAPQHWRRVLRTGRTSRAAWQERFGPITGPLLDVGSGDSPLVFEAAGNGVPAIAVDPQFASRTPAWPGQVAVAALAEALPFRDGVFAFVNASYVLQHVRPVRLALLELLRVTRPGGALVVHPVWAGRRCRAALGGLPGVRVVPGSPFLSRRQRASLVIHVPEFGAVAGLVKVVRAARPPALTRVLGAFAMRLVIFVRRTTSVGPGAVR